MRICEGNVVNSEFRDNVLNIKPKGLGHGAVKEEVFDVFCEAAMMAIRSAIYSHTMEALSSV